MLLFKSMVIKTLPKKSYKLSIVNSIVKLVFGICDFFSSN